MTIDESQAASAMTATCASSTSALTTWAFMRSPERTLLRRAVTIQMVRIKIPFGTRLGLTPRTASALYAEHSVPAVAVEARRACA
jgi:hypothetical protein